MLDSRLPGFHTLSRPDRLARLVARGWLVADELPLFTDSADLARLERVSENVLGSLATPLSLVTNVVVNGRPRLVPMAVEEPSVVAACSNAALLAAGAGGVVATRGERQLRGQVLVAYPGPGADMNRALALMERDFVAGANARHPRLAAAGGGLSHITYRPLADGDEPLGVFDLHCHPGDAMGANAVNDMAEQFAALLRERQVGQVQGAIVSNHSPGSRCRATVRIPPELLGPTPDQGIVVARRMATLSRWAQLDRYRRATHIKGILNGMQAVATALYQDTRALVSTLWSDLAPDETGAIWTFDGEVLAGTLAVPVVCGVVGGTGPVMPTTPLLLRWLGVTEAGDLEEVLAAVGLLQNLAALRAIATDGIQRGHMQLHARKHEDRNE
jgi:hydroxymethylglutaryl-CoA reductase